MNEFKQSLYQQIGGRPKLVELLKHFYADVRQHTLIGPIFLERIKDWPAHIENIADFWSGLTGGPASYRGGMAWKHIALNLKEPHFQAWLELWKRTCHTHLSESAAKEMSQIADNIGNRLRTIVAHQASNDSIETTSDH